MIKNLVVALFSVITGSAYAGDGERVANLIQGANSSELAAMFNTSIELITPGSSGVNTRDQARIVLDNFFRNNTPVKASVTHETTGTSNSMMVISLVTKTGTYRISIVGCYKTGSFVINEFKIT